MTLSELSFEWIESYQKDHIKHQTYIKYTCCINNYINPFLGRKEINALTRRDLQEYINNLKHFKGSRTGKELSSSTVNSVLATLKLIFGYAVDFDILSINPTDRVRGAKKEYERNVKCFSIREQKRIERYCYEKNDILWFGIILDLYTGLRIGELLALQWKDIDLKENIININKTLYISKNEKDLWVEMIDSPKSKTSIREIPLPRHISNQLRIFKKDATSKRVFATNDGHPLDARTYRWRYNQMLKHLRIKHIPFHSLRHTFATRAIENGMDVKTLAEILGHANPSITLNIYTHSMIGHKKKAMLAMKSLVDVPML